MGDCVRKIEMPGAERKGNAAGGGKEKATAWDSGWMGRLLTAKFGKAQSHHRLRVNIGWNQPIGGISRWESSNCHDVVFSMESDQSKEAYLEESEFKKDAAWQFIY
uniref:Uncharacterized protein n=1 Tax=Oryza sativa subsp. japonica TaxID=39947 RepID=Q8H5T1_ORYSJ|nr:hypothetical protein [Oryza sativa Japonica Group]